MLPLLSLHAIAARRGDGLRPELLALFERHARLGTGLGASIEPDGTEPACGTSEVIPDHSVSKDGPDAPLTSSTYRPER